MNSAPTTDRDRNQRRTDPTVWRTLFAAVGLVFAMAGLAVLVVHAQTPGQRKASPPDWPVASELIRDQERPTLVMFLHPHCPCSRATLREFERLQVQRKSVRTVMVFLRPEQTPVDWERGELWDWAAAMPGVEVHVDRSGTESRRFGVATSGQACLYGVDGRLLFSGGITPARGHAGDNLGRTTLEKLLTVGHSNTTTTPVYGCPLYSACETKASEIGSGR